MPRSSWLTFLVALGAAFMVWALSPWVTDYQQPWDAPGVYCYAALFLAGAGSGFIAVKPLWARHVGSIFGQALYGLLFLSMGPLGRCGPSFSRLVVIYFF